MQTKTKRLLWKAVYSLTNSDKYSGIHKYIMSIIYASLTNVGLIFSKTYTDSFQIYITLSFVVLFWGLIFNNFHFSKGCVILPSLLILIYAITGDSVLMPISLIIFTVTFISGIIWGKDFKRLSETAL